MSTPTTTVAPVLPSLSSFQYGNTQVNAPCKTSLVAGSGYGFRALFPLNFNPLIQYAVVIFLHGIGECGIDNNLQLTAGGNTANGALAMVSAANQATFPCIFIAPQCPVGYNWSNGISAQEIDNLFTLLKTQFPNAIDWTRIYLTGLSLGGFGTYDIPYNLLAGTGVNPFAALAPMSGDIGFYSPRVASTQPLNPIWAFHAQNDTTVLDSNSDELYVPELRAAGQTVIFSDYQNGGHDIWPLAYQHPQLLPWLFSQRKGTPVQNPAFLASGSAPNNTGIVGGVMTDYGGNTTINFPAPTTAPVAPVVTTAPATPVTIPVSVTTPVNLALGAVATTSSTEATSTPASAAIDGNTATRWSSFYADPQWLMVDLGAPFAIKEVDLTWETACGANYEIQTSLDGVTWTVQANVVGNAQTGLIAYPFPFVVARYVRMYGTKRATGWGYSIWEMTVNAVTLEDFTDALLAAQNK